MICSLLIENASKATSQGSDKKKNCKLKKRKRKQRSTFSFRKKVMLMTVTTTTTLHSRFTIFLKRNFGEIFAPWLFQEFIYWHCLHSRRTFFGGGLEKVKETSICFEQKANRNAFSHFINVQHLMLFWLIPMKHGKLWRPETFCQKIFVHECDPHWTDLCF